MEEKTEEYRKKTEEQFKDYRKTGIALTATQITLSIIFLNVLSQLHGKENLSISILFLGGGFCFIFSLLGAVTAQYFHYEAEYNRARQTFNFYMYWETHKDAEDKRDTYFQKASQHSIKVSQYFNAGDRAIKSSTFLLVSGIILLTLHITSI